VVETNPIKKLVRGYSEIKIGGEGIKVKPMPKDAEAILVVTSAGRSGIDGSGASKLTEVMKAIIKRANPGITDSELDEIVATHYGEILEELMVMFGFASREQIKMMAKNLAAGPAQG